MTTDIDSILNAIKTTLQAETRLSSVTAYHLVDGMVPGVKPTISIGCGQLRYSDYDRDQDEVIAPVRVYVYAQDMQAERGETTIRNLAKEIRYTLLANMDLGGLVDASTVTGISFDSEQMQQAMLLHFACVEYDVKYYEPRQRPPASDPPTVAEFVGTLNSETLDIQY